MKRLSPQAGRAGVLGCVLLAAMSCAALAQTTGAVSPRPAPAEPPVNEEPAPGGCMPIGVTASGEIVFPFQCKEFIELHKAANRKSAADESQKPAPPDQKPDAAEEKSVAKQSAAIEKPGIAEVKPAAAEEKPAAAEKNPAAEKQSSGKQEESVVPENSKPATEPAGPVPLPRRAERERAFGPPGCTHFRSYDPASASYRTFDGQRHECREVVGQSFRK